MLSEIVTRCIVHNPYPLGAYAPNALRILTLMIIVIPYPLSAYAPNVLRNIDVNDCREYVAYTEAAEAAGVSPQFALYIFRMP